VELFAARLVEWYRQNARRFPWRDSSTGPYPTLIAEIMLRKTTARNVEHVFTAFMSRYPSVHTLAEANEPELRDLIRPLGIADRARLLCTTAQAICEKHNGQVPASLAALLALPGVGRYTANAVRCFGYGQPVALLDTNVIRVLNRVFSVKSTKPRPHTDPNLWAIAESLVPPEQSQSYNRSLLDLGATICTFRNPRCHSCPLADQCDYFRRGSL